MQKYWANFAHKGDPNSSGLVTWPAYDAAGDKNINFADPVSSSSGLQKEACDFWDHYLESH